MKKIFVLLFLLFFISVLSFSQKTEIGLNFGIGQFQNKDNVFSDNYNYETNLYNSFLSGSLYLNSFLKESNYFISFGLKSNEFQHYEFQDNLRVNCISKFLKIPIIFYSREKISDFIYLDVGLGVYSGILTKQYQILPDNTSSEYGFASYTNFGISASGYLIYTPNNKGGFKFGINSDYDLAKISTKDENVIINFYSSVVFELGVFLKF